MQCEVPNEGLSASDGSGTDKHNWIPSQAFLEREEEFEIAMVPYEELVPISDDTSSSHQKKGSDLS